MVVWMYTGATPCWLLWAEAIPLYDWVVFNKRPIKCAHTYIYMVLHYCAENIYWKCIKCAHTYVCMSPCIQMRPIRSTNWKWSCQILHWYNFTMEYERCMHVCNFHRPFEKRWSLSSGITASTEPRVIKKKKKVTASGFFMFDFFKKNLFYK